MTVRQLARDSILLALAAAFSFLESLIPSPAGIRLGLSALILLYALLFLKPAEGTAILLLKSCFVFFTRGASAGILSLSGGLLSFFCMMLLLHLRASLLLTSACGGFLHNLGQLAAASCMMHSTAIFAYLPILGTTGILAGCLNAYCFFLLLRVLPQTQTPLLSPMKSTQKGCHS